MSETSTLKPAVFPINDNLKAIEQDAVGKYPFVFLLESETAQQLTKLNTNLKALGKDPVDTNQLINEALSSALKTLLVKHRHPHDEPDYYVPHHYLHPMVGDYWNERMCGYCRVQEVFSDDDFVIQTYSNFGILEEGRLYRINRKWLARIVAYRWQDLYAKAQPVARDFCADVYPATKAPEKAAQRKLWYETHKYAVIDVRDRDPADTN